MTNEWKEAEIQARIDKSSALKSLDPEIARRVVDKSSGYSEVLNFERHFSIVILLNKEGTGPSSIIQKNGRGDFDFNVDSASDLSVPVENSSVPLQYEEQPAKGKSSPVYRTPENSEEN